MLIDTQLRLPEDLLEQARSKATREGRSLSALVEDALRQFVEETQKSVGTPRVLPPVSKATGGLRPGIDLEDTAAIQEMEDLEYIKRFDFWMILPDVNVLVYAYRSDASHHPVCKAWLDRVIDSEEVFAISTLSLAAVSRIVTNKRTFAQANTINEVFVFCDNLLKQPHCRVVEPGPLHWDIFKRLCVETNLYGPNTTDAWYTAMAIEHGCTWITFDRDFARFPGLDWREPAL